MNQEHPSGSWTRAFGRGLAAAVALAATGCLGGSFVDSGAGFEASSAGVEGDDGRVGVFDRVPFDDVPAGYWAFDSIEALAAAGITVGCSENPRLYCPERATSRAEAAVFLIKAEHGADYAPPAATGHVFTDVPADYWAAPWIEQLAAEGITAGYGDGRFGPNDVLIRAQAAVLILKTEHGAGYLPPGAACRFPDVPAGSWAAAWIEQLAVEGITTGYEDGSYGPNDAATRAQMAVLLARAFDLP